MLARSAEPSPELMARIENALDTDPDRPWCVHRLYEELLTPSDRQDRESMLDATERAADELAEKGRVQRERISAFSIGVHCEDSVYWSRRSEKARLSDFGPEYEEPVVLRRLASHFRCTGL